jgi:xylulose-5-phosphate/fructose-6-phosphate phosphoketolase
MDVIDRVSALKVAGAHAKEKFRNQQIDCRHYANQHGMDRPEIVNWKWPYQK